MASQNPQSVQPDIRAAIQTILTPLQISSVIDTKFKHTLTKFGPSELIRLLNSVLMFSSAVMDERTRFSLFLVLIKSITLNSGTTIITDRDVIEFVGARAQCETIFSQRATTQSGFPTSRDGNSRCWLCGWSVQEMGYVLNPEENWMNDGLTARQKASCLNAPECEHLVPAAASIIYLDLPQNIPGAPPSEVNLFSNYEWAHRLCNGNKDSLLFFKMFDEAGNLTNPEPSVNLIGTYLTSLSSAPAIVRLITNGGLERATWLHSRGGQIMARIKIVTDYIAAKRSRYAAGRNVGGFYIEDLSSLSRNVNFLYRNLITSLHENAGKIIAKNTEESKTEWLIAKYNELYDELKSNIFPPLLIEAATASGITNLLPDMSAEYSAIQGLTQFLNNIGIIAVNLESAKHPLLPQFNQLFLQYTTRFSAIKEEANRNFDGVVTGADMIALLRGQIHMLMENQFPELKSYFDRTKQTGEFARDSLFCGETGLLTGVLTDERYGVICHGQPGNAGGKRKKTRKTKLKRKRTKRNKNSKK
jgi:hypothetical protein